LATTRHTAGSTGPKKVPFSCLDVLNDNPPFPGFSMQVSSFYEKRRAYTEFP
jgi:hypothetical protein